MNYMNNVFRIMNFGKNERTNCTHNSLFIIPLQGKQNSKFGFTLIELLVVISIIGILVSLGMASYSMIEKQARNAKRKADLTQLKTALESYYAAKGTYPSSNGVWRGTCSTYGSHDTTGADGYIPNLAPAFVEVLPTDPRDGQAYAPCNDGGSNCYLYLSDEIDYKLLAHCGSESYPALGDGTCCNLERKLITCSQTGCPKNQPFCDPSRRDTTSRTWAWQVHSSSTSICW